MFRLLSPRRRRTERDAAGTTTDHRDLIALVNEARSDRERWQATSLHGMRLGRR